MSLQAMEVLAVVVGLAVTVVEYYFGSSAGPATRTDDPRNDR